MSKNIPSLFKKPIKEKDFEKKILKKIYITSDLEFVKSIFSKNSDGYYEIKKELTKEENDRLKKIADTIKKNKGIIDPVKPTLVATIIGAIVIFYVLFKDYLAKRAIEKGLEAVFNAKVEAKGVRLGIIKAGIKLKSLTVASETEPFKNLFELGKTEISFLTPELFKGKFVIKNIECSEIKWNTDRKTDGRLKKPNKENKSEQLTKKEEKKGEKAPSFDFSKIDTSKIVDEQLTNLKSIAFYSNLNIEVAQSKAKWETNLSQSKKDIDEATKKVNELKGINVNNIKTIQDAEAALKKINETYPFINELKTKTEKLTKDFSMEAANIDKKTKEASSLIDKDLSYLKSFLKLPEGGAKGIASSIATKYLSQKFGKLYYYAMKGINISKQMKKDDKKEKKTVKREPKRTGYNVPFPTTVYPKFLLESMVTSVHSDISYNGWLSNVSSDQDLWGKPATFFFDRTENDRKIVVNGFVDTRTNEEKSLGLSFEVNNYPFTINKGLEIVKAKSVNGLYRLQNNLEIMKDNSVIGKLFLKLINLNVELESDDIISKAFLEAIKSTPTVDMEVGYTISSSMAMNFDVKSNLDTILSKALGKIIDGYVKEADTELRKKLMEKLEPELKKNKELAALYDGLKGKSLEDLKNVDKLKEEIDKKKKEIDNQIEKIKKEAEDKVKKEAESKIKEKAKDLPKIPGF
ncbi:MAG: TIGR03545 family protein [Brevinematales bacterium]|nr:TIGR03545 family protein [Brevinematales bacterium]